MSIRDGKPDLLLVYDSGNYFDAACDFHSSRSWAIHNDLCYRADLQATLHTPRFRGEKPPRKMTDTNGWAAKCRLHGWTVTIEFFTASPEVTAELLALAPPAQAAWKDVLHGQPNLNAQ